MRAKTTITRRDFLKLVGTASLASLLSSRQPGLQSTQAHSHQKRSQYNASSPNILIVLFDAWSASNISLYGYQRRTTPNLETLAQRAVVYHHHYAGSNCTSSGTASLLTGLYPWKHRAKQTYSQVLDRYVKHNIFRCLPETYYRFAYTQNPLCYALLNQFQDDIDHLLKPGELALDHNSIAEYISRDNYYPISSAENYILRSGRTPSVSIFNALLDHLNRFIKNSILTRTYQQDYPRGLVEWGFMKEAPLFSFKLEDAIDWIINKSLSTPQPYFGFVHLLPPHAPYNPRIEFTQLFEDDWQPAQKPIFLKTDPTTDLPKIHTLRWEYDQYIAYVDSEFGRLYKSLEQSGGLDNTILVLTSDHGESFERNVFSHNTPALYQPLTRVPLLLFLPGQQSRVDIDTPTSAVDLFPGLIKMAGGTTPASCDGIPLPLQQQPNSTNRQLYSIQINDNPRLDPFSKASFAMIQWPYKLTYYRGYEQVQNEFELYNLSEDSEEMHNLFSPSSPISQNLQAVLQAAIEQNEFLE